MSLLECPKALLIWHTSLQSKWKLYAVGFMQLSLEQVVSLLSLSMKRYVLQIRPLSYTQTTSSMLSS